METARVAAPEPERATSTTSELASLVTDASKPSVISEGFEMRGDIMSNGILHVDGRVVGSITCESIHITGNGVVEGTVRCATFNVKGRFKGTATCERLVVNATAHVHADLYYRSLSVAAGAVIQGELHQQE